MRFQSAGYTLPLCTRVTKGFLTATCASPLIYLAMASTAAGSNAAESTVKPILPSLSASEFRLYNRMADGMEYYVRHSSATKSAMPLTRPSIRTSATPGTSCTPQSIR